MKQKLTSIDLFSGCGGLSLGLKKAGFNTLAAIEIDSLAAETYRQNHPDTLLINNDIRKVNLKKLRGQLELKKGDLDLLAGCPPCQGFSTLRTNKKVVSVDDPRNSLMFRFLDFAIEFMPKTIMMENVPGLAKGRRIKKFIEALNDLGYIVNFDVLNVADFGVPQRRKRFILIASKNQFVPFAKPDSHRVLVQDVLKDIESPTKSKDPAHNHGETRSARVREVISAIPKNGGSRSSLPKRLQMKCHENGPGFNDVYGRIKWDAVAPTITGGCTNPSKGRFLHPSENRTITVREAALLQGFPKNYFFSMRKGKGKASLMVGNALPPEFIKRQAIEIKKVISKIK